MIHQRASEVLTLRSPLAIHVPSNECGILDPPLIILLVPIVPRKTISSYVASL